MTLKRSDFLKTLSNWTFYWASYSFFRIMCYEIQKKSKYFVSVKYCTQSEWHYPVKSWLCFADLISMLYRSVFENKVDLRVALLKQPQVKFACLRKLIRLLRCLLCLIFWIYRFLTVILYLICLLTLSAEHKGIWFGKYTWFSTIQGLFVIFFRIKMNQCPFDRVFKDNLLQWTESI